MSIISFIASLLYSDAAPGPGPVPTIVGTPTATTGNTVVIDAAVAAGDLILICSYAAWADLTTTVLNTPTGIGALTEVLVAATSSGTRRVRMGVWAKIADGTEGGQTVTGGHTGGGNSDGMGHIVLRGIHPTLWQEDVQQSDGNGSGPAVAPDIGPTAGDNRRVVAFAAEAENDAAWSGDWTGGTGPDLVQQAFAQTAGGDDRTTWVLSAEVPTAGTEITGKTAPNSATAHKGQTVIAITVRPADA